MDKHIEVMISEKEINTRICELAEQINKDYAGKELHLIVILKGSVFFACELAKRITVPVTLDFMAVSSYGDGMVSAGKITVKKELDEDIRGKDVLIVEDIIDSGNTLFHLKNLLLYLKELGFDITFLPVTKEGKVEPEVLERAIREDTILVSIMHVNNEIGAVQDLELLGDIIKKKKNDTLFHVDAIQSFGKFQINPKKAKIDLLSVSGHKIHGPKGVGFLYIKDKTRIKPIIYGGGQQKGMRSGTDNVPGIAGLGVAAKEMYEHLEERNQHMSHLKEHFLNRMEELSGCYYNKGEAPHIISISFEGIKSEVLLHALEEKEIYVSSGSACSSNHPGISGTLKAIGVREDLLDSTLRFSLCGENTIEQMDATIEELKRLLPQLRRFVRK